MSGGLPQIAALALAWTVAFALVVASFAAHGRPTLSRRLHRASQTATALVIAPTALAFLASLTP